MSYFLGLILALLPTYLIRFSAGGGSAFGGKIPHIPTTLLEILIGVFLILVFANAKKTDWQKIRNLGRINWPILGFVVAGIIATIVSPARLVAFGQLKAFIIEPVLMFYAAIIVLKTKEQTNRALKWLLGSAVLISLFGIIQYITYLGLPLRFWGTGVEVERITSVFDYPNALALYLAPLIGFYFALWLKKYELGLRKYVLPTSLILMTIGLVLTFSRGAWFAILVGILVLLIKQFSAKKVIPPVILLAIILFFIPPIHQRILLGFSDPSSLAHFDLWKFSINKIADNPILGNGLAGFATFNQGVSYPHNIFLNFWLEMGLLGLVSFAAVLILAWERYIKKPSPLALTASIFLLILLIHGLVDVPYFKNDLSVLFWFVVSLNYI